MNGVVTLHDALFSQSRYLQRGGQPVTGAVCSDGAHPLSTGLVLFLQDVRPPSPLWSPTKAPWNRQYMVGVAGKIHQLLPGLALHNTSTMWDVFISNNSLHISRDLPMSPFSSNRISGRNLLSVGGRS